MKQVAIDFLREIHYPLYFDDEVTVKGALFSVSELSCYGAQERRQAADLLYALNNPLADTVTQIDTANDLVMVDPEPEPEPATEPATSDGGPKKRK